jgi:hypothetical protein
MKTPCMATSAVRVDDEPGSCVENLDHPIVEPAYIGGFTGWFPGDSWLSAANRVLRELDELEQQKGARDACDARPDAVSNDQIIRPHR